MQNSPLPLQFVQPVLKCIPK